MALGVNGNLYGANISAGNYYNPFDVNYGHSSQVTATMGQPNLNKLYTDPSFMGSDGVVHLMWK